MPEQRRDWYPASQQDARETQRRAREALRQGRVFEAAAGTVGGIARVPGNFLWDLYQNATRDISSIPQQPVVRAFTGQAPVTATPAAAPATQAFAPPQAAPVGAGLSFSPPMTDLFRGLPGETITSTYRDPAKNKSVGGVNNSYHTQRDQWGRALGRDSVPPRGMSMAEYASQLRALNPQMEVINEGDHVHMEPKAGANLDMAMPAFVNPFDPSYHNAAGAELNKAEQAALQPFSLETAIDSMPEMPEPIKGPTKDFSKQDEILESLRPVVMTEKEQQQISRKNWFAGMAQGLASLPDGASLGKVLAAVGAGALAGRAAGMDEIQTRMDAFDEKMAKFKALQFQQEGVKADQAFAEAQAEVNQMNEHNWKKFGLAYDQWNKDNQVSLQGNSIVVNKRVQKEDGSSAIVTNIVPVAPAVRSAFAVHRASLLQNMGNMHMQGAMMQGSAANQYIASAAIASAQTGQVSEEAGLINTTGILASELVINRQGPNIFGADAWNEALELAQEKLKAEGIVPGADGYTEALNQQLATDLTTDALRSPELMQRLIQQAGSIQQISAGRRYQERETRIKTDRRGTTTTVVE